MPLPTLRDVAVTLDASPGPDHDALHLIEQGHARIVRLHDGAPLCGIWHYAHLEARDIPPAALIELEGRHRDPSDITYLIATWQHHANCPGIDGDELTPATATAVAPYLETPGQLPLPVQEMTT